jgi:VIT1/CCC1 family predicted Fe2+/Mn2+ transporter
MRESALDPALRPAVEAFQRDEITEYFIYGKLADAEGNPDNRRILRQIGEDEKRHAEFWKRYSLREIAPDGMRVWFLYGVTRLFGLTFGLKLMERGEKEAQDRYNRILAAIPEAKAIHDDEESHEHDLIGMIEEERLRYMGSIVLGLSDALVELTGALAGFTFALQETKLIGVAGLVTGIAASFSMAASEFLSQRSESAVRSPLKSSLYTFSAYLLTVALLVAPYLVFEDCFVSLSVTILNALLVILLFSFYISVAQDLSFRKRFVEMAGITLGVASLSFGIGYLVRLWLGVDA